MKNKKKNSRLFENLFLAVALTIWLMYLMFLITSKTYF